MPRLVIGLILAAIVLPGTFLGAWLYPGDPFALHTDVALSSPSWAHPLGTDALGRDLLARLFSGGVATLLVSIPATLLTFVIGCAYGLASGLGPKWLDQVMMRVLDAVLALPSLIVLIFFAAIVTLNVPSLILLLGLISWPSLARLVRNETIAQRDREFVLAARQAGGGPFYVARVHLARVMAPILVVNATLLTGELIVVLSALSFLGLGVQPPRTSWGGLLENGLSLIALKPWWLILPPGLLIFAALFSTSLIGEALLARRVGAR
jgi:peptide/nickel transport system permease protein